MHLKSYSESTCHKYDYTIKASLNDSFMEGFIALNTINFAEIARRDNDGFVSRPLLSLTLAPPPRPHGRLPMPRRRLTFSLALAPGRGPALNADGRGPARDASPRWPRTTPPPPAILLARIPHVRWPPAATALHTAARSSPCDASPRCRPPGADPPRLVCVAAALHAAVPRRSS